MALALRQRARSVFKTFGTRAKASVSPYVQYVLGHGSIETSSGLTMSPDVALSLGSVYRAVMLLSDIIASHPWRVVRHLEDGGREIDRTSDAARAVAMLSPNDIETAAVAFLAGGNGYLRVVRGAGGAVLRLIAIPAVRVGIETSRDGRLWYRVVGSQPDQDELLSEDDVAHSRFRCLRDPRIGVSPLETCAEAFGMAAMVRQFSSYFFRNGMQPTHALLVQGHMSEDAIGRLTQEWAAMNRGSAAVGAVILESGMQVQSLEAGRSARDAMLVEAAEHYVAEVARVFGIPPSYLAQSGERASTAVEESRQLALSCTNTVQRFARSVEEVIFTEAQRVEGWRVEVDLSQMLLGHGTELIDYWSKAANAGLATPNEARVRLGLPRLGEDADILRAPVNTAPLGDWAAPETPAKPSPEPEVRRVLTLAEAHAGV